MKKLLLILLLPTMLFADDWGKTGHRVIGQIAQDNLTPAATSAINELLGGETLATVSTWADEMRSNPEFDKYSIWHYVNLPEDKKYHEVEHTQDNAVIIIERAIEKLSDDSVSNEDKTFYLKFLVHLVGDIHQPMHLGEKRDKGGNNIKLKWFGENTNLHRIWDSDIIDSSKMSYTELTNNLPRLSNSKKKEYESSPIEVWVKETHDLTKKIYKDLPENINLDYPKRKEFLNPSVILTDSKLGFNDSEFWGTENIIEPENTIHNAIKKIQRKLKRLRN